MNKLTIAVICFLVCLSASLVFAQPAAPHPGLASADWSIKQAHVLNAESNDAVWKFISDLPGSTGLGKLCKFQFADLRHSGQLSLVVSDDGGGTMDCCNDVEIFDKSPAGIEYYDISSTGASSFDGVEDINGDGNNEVIVDSTFAAPSGGARCWATWPVVYAWNGTGYADVSAEFKGFYRQTLARLEHQIAAPPSLPAPEQVETFESHPTGLAARIIRPPDAAPAFSSDAADSDCEKAETAKIQRFLGISRDAGIEDAVKWAQSDDPVMRRFGAIVLADIGTPEAIQDLRTLTNDPEPNVARSAKEDLKYATNSKPVAYPTIQGELLTPDTGYPSAK
jgi:hypothetical protein